MGEAAFDEPFYISAWTLNELENIKTNHNKDDSVRYKARQMTKLLDQHRTDGSYTLEYDMMLVSADVVIQGYPVAPETTDTKICEAANRVNNKQHITFCPDDICCKLIAHDIFNLPVCSTSDILRNDDYTGYKEVTVLDDAEHAALYENPTANIYDLLPNQYIILYDKDSNVTDMLRP